jgi:hypothetical protein
MNLRWWLRLIRQQYKLPSQIRPMLHFQVFLTLNTAQGEAEPRAELFNMFAINLRQWLLSAIL